MSIPLSDAIPVTPVGVSSNSAAIPSADPAAWPLIGRREIMNRALRAAATDRFGVVLVGPRGSGRTRLARDLAVRLRADGRRVTWISATRAGSTVPFGALSHLLPRRDDAPDTGTTAIGTLLRLVDLIDDAAAAPAVLAIDDADLLDPASATLVHQVALHRTAFVVATLSASPGTGTPAPDAVTALWKDQVAERLDVPVLSEPDTHALIAHALGGPLESAGRRALSRLSAGLPLVVVETVLAARTTGALSEVDGMWRWSGRFPATPRLTDVVNDQLGDLDDTERAILELVAVGQPLPLSIVEDPDERAALVAAERRGLVRVQWHGVRGGLVFAVPAYGEVLRAQVTPLREREISRRMADHLAATPLRRTDDSMHLAWWRLAAGEPVDSGVLLAAARRAIGQFDMARAAAFAEAARRAGVGHAASLLLAEADFFRGRCRTAMDELPPERVIPDPEVRDEVAAIRRASEFWACADDPGPDPDSAPSVGTLGIHLLAGGTDTVAKHGQVLLSSGELGPDRTVTTAFATTLAAGLLGDPEQVDQAASAGYAVALEHPCDVPVGRLMVDLARCLALVLTGAAGEAAILAKTAIRTPVNPEATLLTAGLAWLRGILARLQGRLPAARTALHETATLLHDALGNRLRGVCYGELAAVYAMGGDDRRAAYWLARMERELPPPGVGFDAWMLGQRAWVAANDDLDRARGYALRAADTAREARQPAVAALMLFDAARLGAVGDVQRRLTDPDGPIVVEVFTAAIAALSVADADRLDSAAVNLRRAGYLLPAAELASLAHRRHLAAGERTRALAAQAMMEELLRGCGDVQTPLLGRADEWSHGLTPRELQTARLAAAGLTAPAIATRLGLSPRTVNNHLGRVYTKLGVSGRHELAASLRMVTDD